MTIITKPTLADNPSGALILYDNLLTSVSSTTYDPLLIPNTFERVKLSTSSGNVLLQLSTPATVDSIGIAAHSMGRTGNLTVTVEVAATVSGALTEITEFVPTDNSPIFIKFTAQTVGEVKITWLDTDTSQDLEIGVIYAGLSLQMPTDIYGGHSPIPLNENSEYQSVISESGQFLGRTVIRKGSEGNLSWRNLDDSWLRTTFKAFMDSAISTPFFIQWRPDYYDEALFCQTTGDPKISNMGGGRRAMQASINVRAHSE